MFVLIDAMPHYGSTGAAGEAIDRLLAAFEADGIPYRTLSEGQALVARGHEITTVTMHALIGLPERNEQ